MRFPSLREKDLLAGLRKEFSGGNKGLILGIGDDAAVIRGKKTQFFLTTDLLIEGVHFIVSFHPPFNLGRKALNVNLSDIAAMGGKPRYALLGLGLRADLSPSWVGRFCDGFKSAAEESGTKLVGGDISAAPKIVISVALLGEGERAIQRGGARPGDWIFVSGTLGDAACGFRLLKRGLLSGKKRQASALVRAFLDPKPQIALGRALSLRGLATAMIDLSDGLSVDLLHLCEESKTGAEVYLEKLPLSAEIRKFEKKPEELALHGGEDYQLLFTVSPFRVNELAQLRKRYSIHWIGRMTARSGIRIIDKKGKSHRLEPRGYQHFTS